jgi:CBS-domain-containing membrane protein
MPTKCPVAPITIRAIDSLEAAVARRHRNKVKRLVVSGDDRRVQGIVSRADLVKLFAAKVLGSPALAAISAGRCRSAHRMGPESAARAERQALPRHRRGSLHGGRATEAASTANWSSRSSCSEWPPK